MSTLFEEFVAEFLRRHRDNIELDEGRRLAKVERQRVLGKLFNEFDMRVDLILEDDQGERFLVDTKYKVLEPARDHAGLSQTDFYQVYAYARAGKEKYRENFLLYPATEVPVESDFDQDGLMLRVRQFDPRKIYDPEMGRLDVRAAANELGLEARAGTV
jgi:5-methylcytosine-specific restriction endonuclease McrBC regulatory subunit McrC